MKLILFLSMIVATSSAFAQSDKPAPDKAPVSVVRVSLSNEYESECGSYVEESNTYDYWDGKVIQVISGNRIVVESGKGRKKKAVTVQLAGIASNKNEENLRKFLIAHILNKRVTVKGNKEEDTDTEMFAIIQSKEFSDLNRHLIESGLADYEEPGYSYSISYVTTCIYRHLLENAKKEKIGIWSR
jgi:endonuclease YncB( thermonuclease family)